MEASHLNRPLLESPPTRNRQRLRSAILLAFGAFGTLTLLANVGWALGTVTTIVDPVDDVIILGSGGVVWSNGTRAVESSGEFTWACELSSGGVALVEEDAAVLWDWNPRSTRPPSRTIMLQRLRRPVQCVQHGAVLYVACFGVEEERGHSGIALIDVDTWTIMRERVLLETRHIHHVYVNARSSTGDDDASPVLLFTDVGDPWVAPPVLGGLFQVDARLEPHMLPARIGPPMHARAAALPPALVPDAATSKGEWSKQLLGSSIYVITQEPFGEPTQLVALDDTSGADWADGMLEASDVARVVLPRAAIPSDGGADVFVQRGRLFATDRPGGNGSMYELSWSSGKLQVVDSTELGVHPRYTDPLGSRELIYSVSRDDGLLTIIDASSAHPVVRARQQAHVALPCFLARWPMPTAT